LLLSLVILFLLPVSVLSAVTVSFGHTLQQQQQQQQSL